MTDFAAEDMKFAADRMLGRLAKWLRVLGQDVVYGRHLSGYSLIHMARRENRLILTRDSRLKIKQPPQLIFITSDDYAEQLRQVVAECGLSIGEAAFTRCLACNAVLRPRPKEALKEIVPPYVFATQQNFSCCPKCGRVYWRATHHQRMLDELQNMGLFRPGV